MHCPPKAKTAGSNPAGCAIKPKLVLPFFYLSGNSCQTAFFIKTWILAVALLPQDDTKLRFVVPPAPGGEPQKKPSPHTGTVSFLGKETFIRREAL